MENNISPITLEIMGNLILSVAEEMGVTLVKTAYSTNIKERKDASTAVFDMKGRMIAQAEHVPMHLGSMLSVVTEVLKKFPISSIKEGDMFITNDPYTGGGTHLPDITMVEPVFYNGEITAFVANIAHHSDIGGKVPGSTSSDANSIFQEGIRIPLVKICKNGSIVNETMEFILNNTRTPEERKGDLYAQISCNKAGTKRMRDVINKYGKYKFSTYTDGLINYAENLMRMGIKKLPDGEYSFEDYLDDDGVELNKPVPIKVNIIIENNRAIVDFTGTSPQVKGPLNLVLSGTLTTVFYCFKALAGQSIFSNEGIYRAIEVVAPDNSIVNCSPPAPVGVRIDAAQRIADVVFGALAKAAPDRVIAACNSSVTSAIFSGVNPETDKYFVYLETIAGGSGAHKNNDGLSGVQVHMTNTSNLPIEALEREYPIMVESYNFAPDSGGPGLYRGGLGLKRQFRMLGDNLLFTGLGERHVFSPWGIAGGKNGSSGSFWLKRANSEIKKLNSKISDIELDKEDQITIFTPGAGGYGNPLFRDVEKVFQDVKEGKVSVASARDDYGVILTDDVKEVDSEATTRVRDERCS
ncbi:hydantoinase B/oxoprolinase family protein [Virgibacillus dakarensis]|uniref:N-methylhydantoinase B n=1 Tax=Lentibacillus populi TaxID=1827502 RepID=A0A9W5TXN7_9BACI|nr:hydantoinase B/oxoprolinase family protein [Lentibacillus populi]MTW85820.1 hydantoinase B/oxoprolinase family protein [Virgibacillus dakarensis]GGB39244.1 N-methylhydantoinase B [Lentibacillus populi]